MDDHRHACQRQHRILGHFLAVQAWLRAVDCIVLERDDVRSFLDLERIKEQRVNWLREDLLPWFPHQSAYERGVGLSYSLHSLYLSRIEIERWLPDGELTTEQRIGRMKKGAPRTEAFARLPSGHRHLNEYDVVQYLALMDGGIGLPQPLGSVPR